MQNTNKLKRNLITTLIIVVVFVAGFFTNTLYQKSQQKLAASVAKQFVTDLTAGNTAKAYSLASTNLKKAQDSDTFNKAFSGLKASSPVYKGDSIMKGDGWYIYRQLVDGMPQIEDGSTQADFAITMVRQGASWKVDNAVVQ